MHRVLFVLGMSALIFFVCGCAKQPPFRTVATVEQLMEGMVAHTAEVVFESVGTIVSEKGIEEIAPKNAEEWADVQNSALSLAESANLLMFESRAKDQGDWIKMSQAMMDKALVAAKAAEAKDATALFDAGGEIYVACTNCHEKYIPKEPLPASP